MQRTARSLALVSLMLAGCVTTSPKVTGVPADQVIDALKDRLKLVHPLVVTYKAEKGCTDGDYFITAIPTKASVQLKAAFTDTKTGGLGGQFGIPIVVTPSATVVASSVKTTQTTMNFCALPETLTGTDGQPPGADCLWTLKDKSANYVATLWPTTTEVAHYDKLPAVDHKRLVTVSASEQPAASNAELAEALKAAIGGLLYSNHASACLLAQTTDVQLAFETAVDVTSGFKLSFVFVNAQASLEKKRDFTNTLTVTFNFSKGTSAALLNAYQSL